MLNKSFFLKKKHCQMAMVDSICQTGLDFFSVSQDIFVSYKLIFLEKNIVIVFKIATCTKSCQFTINTAKLGINWYQYQLKKPFTYYQTITNFYYKTSLYFQMKIATDFDVAKWLKERTWLYSFGNMRHIWRWALRAMR